MKDLLARTPYWKALALVLAGGAALLWFQAQVSAAIHSDNSRDDSTYAPHSVVQEVRERMISVEAKLDTLIRRDK